LAEPLPVKILSRIVDPTMAISVVMPALEMAQDTGKLVSWRKKEGEAVAKGEILLEVETDKAVVEVEAQAEGILGGVKAQPGDVIPVGHTIAWLLGPGESVPAGDAPTQAAADAARPASVASSAAAQAPKAAPAGAPSDGRQVRISPKARRLAKENNIDIATLRGSGPDGEILAADILAAASAPAAASPTAAAGAGEEKLSSIGRLMAERTTQSWTTVPHFFVTRELDASALNHARGELLRDIEKSLGVRPTHTDVLVALVARTLAKHPRVNGTWTGTGIRLNPEINVAVAMAVEDGVVTAVIRNAAKLGVGEIAVQRRDLTERARANRLRPEDLSGATFTISNLGMHHVDSFTAIIVQPQAGILAVSAIKDRVVAVDGHPAVRPMMSLTLSSDHRVVGGARAAAFMHDLVGMLLEPQQSLLLP
jgi:pyruvate dehydrogenase E2 component (dihydrolipoyllysine-residue acetyltransferase)